MGPDIVVPVTIFVMIAAVVIVPRYFKSKEREQMQATIRAAIERGQPLPPELIEAMTRNVRPRPSSSSDLRAAIVWLAWGLGIAGFFVAGSYEWSNEMLPLAYIGAIPLFIGAAYLVMALLNAKKDKASA
jgi:uncharacterized membrane protein